MSKVISTESPLVGIQDESVALITEIPMQGFINLRGNVGKGRTKYCTQISKTLGITLPKKNNSVNHNDEYQLFWLGPDENLLVTPPGRQSEVIEKLEAALKSTFHAVTDVSSGYTMIEIAGRYAQTLLRKGCSLDLHSSVFSPKSCAQTLIAQAGVVISIKPGTDDYLVCVRRSYADYLIRWLNNANTGF